MRCLESPPLFDDHQSCTHNWWYQAKTMFKLLYTRWWIGFRWTTFPTTPPLSLCLLINHVGYSRRGTPDSVELCASVVGVGDLEHGASRAGQLPLPGGLTQVHMLPRLTSWGGENRKTLYNKTIIVEPGDDDHLYVKTFCLLKETALKQSS